MLTKAEWDQAFANMEASDWPEDRKQYLRRVWTFMREGKSYSREDFRIVARGTVGPLDSTRSRTTGY